jgi:hypothetical protein
MSLETLAIDAAFAISGKDAWYYPAAGSRKAVRVLVEQATVEQPFGNVTVKLAPREQAGAKILRLRRSEAESPRKDEYVDVPELGTRYTLDDVTLDETGHVWVLPTRARRLS